MSDITIRLLEIRNDQVEKCKKCELLHPSSFEPWVNKAETRLNRLKEQVRTCPEQECENITNEHECLAGVLDDIQKRRADIIWDQAWDRSGNVDKMTQREADIYTELVGLAEDLRGDAS